MHYVHVQVWHAPEGGELREQVLRCVDVEVGLCSATPHALSVCSLLAAPEQALEQHLSASWLRWRWHGRELRREDARYSTHTRPLINYC